jgi:hypothetical protein
MTRREWEALKNESFKAGRVGISTTMAHREMIENIMMGADPSSAARTSFLGITSPLTRPYVEDKAIANVLLILLVVKKTAAFIVESFNVFCPLLGRWCTLHSRETAGFFRAIVQINAPMNYPTALIVYYKTIAMNCTRVGSTLS